jgi:hypothetical protein
LLQLTQTMYLKAQTMFQIVQSILLKVQSRG